MPPAVLKNLRRVMPCFFASSAPICFTRASNCFCRALCGEGMYSSLDAHCTGMGDGNSVSAPSNWASSSGVNMVWASSFVNGHRIPAGSIGKLASQQRETFR